MKVLATISEVTPTKRTVISKATFDDANEALSWARSVQAKQPHLDWLVTKDKKVVDTNAWEDYI